MIENRFTDFFEPSKELRQFGLYTKKFSLASHDAERPGIFSVYGYPWYALAVLGILILEGIALYLSIEKGVDINAVLGLIIIDFFIAGIGHHLTIKEIKYRENKLVFTDGLEAENINSQIRSRKQIKLVSHLLILAMAMLKCHWFLEVYFRSGGIDAIALIVCLFYILAAFLHIVATGYFIYTSIFYIRRWLQRRKHRTSRGKEFAFDLANPRKHYFKPEIALIPAQSSRQSLYLEADHWVLETHGVFTDLQLDELVGKQHSALQKKALVIEGVRHQMNMI